MDEALEWTEAYENTRKKEIVDTILSAKAEKENSGSSLYIILIVVFVFFLLMYLFWSGDEKSAYNILELLRDKNYNIPAKSR